MWNFIRFFIVWVSENLSIPFWTVGHIHLSLSDYLLSEAVLGSIVLHLIVGVGFMLSYKDHLADQKKEYKRNAECLNFYIDHTDEEEKTN